MSQKYGRQVCVVPTGGNMPGTVNNLVTASVYFVTASNDSIGDMQAIINDVLELVRCGVYYNGFTIQASSPLPQPVALEDDRLIWELGFRIL